MRFAYLLAAVVMAACVAVIIFSPSPWHLVAGIWLASLVAVCVIFDRETRLADRSSA